MVQENFTATLAASLRRNWDVKCFSDLDGGTLTYGEVALRIKEMHHLFEGCGIERGDRIGLVGRNTAHWCVTYLAAVTYGAVIVPILPDFTTVEIEHIVRHSECKLLFVAPAIFDRLEEGKMPTVGGVFLLRDFEIAWAEDDKLAKLKQEAPGAVGALTPDNLSFAAIGNEDLTALVLSLIHI